MKKLSKRTYKGIDYIRLSSLNTAEADALSKSLNSRSLIKILMFDEIIEDCVVYSEYEKWFAGYQQEEERVVSPAKSVKQAVSLS